MRGLKQFFTVLRGKVFHSEDLLPAGGIPYVLGQGLNSPYIEPGLKVHWHPPFSIMAAEESARKKSKIPHLFKKLGLKKKSA